MKQSYKKPTRVILGYEMKQQLNGKFKIVEYSHFSNEQTLRKRTIHKNLNHSDAENILYRLERKNPTK